MSQNCYLCTWCKQKARYVYKHININPAYTAAGVTVLGAIYSVKYYDDKYVCGRCEKQYVGWFSSIQETFNGNMEKHCAIKEWDKKLEREKKTREEYLAQLPELIKTLINQNIITTTELGNQVELSIEGYRLHKKWDGTFIKWDGITKLENTDTSTIYSNTTLEDAVWLNGYDYSPAIEVTGNDEISTSTNI